MNTKFKGRISKMGPQLVIVIPKALHSQVETLKDVEIMVSIKTYKTKTLDGYQDASDEKKPVRM
jgi:hypothetical protein